MANIDLTSVFSQMGRRFQSQGSGLVRFEEDFISACNMAISRINIDADLETRISPVDATDAPLELDNAYIHVFVACVVVAMCGLGQRPAAGDEFNVAELEKNLPDLIDSIRQNIMNLAQDADADDEESRVGLGALG